MKKILLYIFIIFIPLHAQHKHAFDFIPSLLKKSADVDALNPIDVTHYDVDLIIDFDNKSISGRARIHLQILDPEANSFFLHLTTPRISKAYLNGQETSFTRTSDKVYFARPLSAQDIVLGIEYAGKPGNDGFGGFFFQNEYAYTVGQGLYSEIPSMLRHWIPSHDVPFDKATLDMRLTVPSEFDAFSNGLLISTNTHNTSKTVFWQEKHPIATYLIAIAVGEYAVLHMSHESVSGALIPLEFYVFPHHLDAAKNDWKNLPRMMDFFEQKFTPYPFDRYSMAEAYNRGAMEHQTMTTYSHQLVTGDNRYDYIVAHELAHHWWGDLVTLGDWKDIWLNEGFAVYSEALYFESQYGGDYLAGYMDALLEIYLAEVARRGHFPIYDPDYMWGGTVYQKGAWVLHMLRWTIGENAFWRTLKAWAENYAYGYALIPDFIALAEEQSGRDLGWFFDQWIYQAGYPDFDITWSYEPNDNRTFTATVDIKQQQWNTFQFNAPLEIQFETARGLVLDTLVSSSEYQSFQVELLAEPFGINIDPNNWLLKQYDLLSNPTPPGVNPNDFYLAQNYPNPFLRGDQTSILFHVAQLDSPHPLSIKIYNILGQEIKTLVDRSMQGGLYETHWDGKDKTGRTVSSGVYFYCLISPINKIEKKLLIFEK